MQSRPALSLIIRAAAVILALLPAGRAFASYESSSWKFSFIADGMYSSNVNFADGTAANKEQSDLFASYRPSVGIKPDVAFGEVELNAGLTAFTFVNHTELNKAFADCGGRISTRIGRRLQVTAEDRYTTRPVEFSKPGNTPVNLTSINEAKVSFLYDFPLAGKDHLYLSGFYSAYTLLSYSNDYYRYGASLDFERRLSGRLKVNLIESFNQSRFYDRQVLSTITTTPTPQPLHTLTVLATQVQLSYRTGPRLETHLAAGVSITRVAARTQYAPTASGGLQWAASSRLNIYADLGYAEQIDTTGNAVRFLSTTGRTEYRLTAKLLNTTTAKFARVSQLVRPLPLNAGGSPNASYVSAGTEFKYNFRRELDTHVGYSYLQGFEGNKYVAHTVMAGIGINL